MCCLVSYVLYTTRIPEVVRSDDRFKREITKRGETGRVYRLCSSLELGDENSRCGMVNQLGPPVSSLIISSGARVGRYAGLSQGHLEIRMHDMSESI